MNQHIEVFQYRKRVIGRVGNRDSELEIGERRGKVSVLDRDLRARSAGECLSPPITDLLVKCDCLINISACAGKAKTEMGCRQPAQRVGNSFP